MPKYQITRDRVKLSDERFDHYLDEALSFFNELESIAGSPPPIANTDTQELTEWRICRWNNFTEAVENCRHKIQAVQYSLSLIDSEIRNPPIPHNRSLPIHLNETEFLDDVVLFEFESFLLQVMSTLDVFVHLLRLFYPVLDSKNPRKIGFNGEKGMAGKETIALLKRGNLEIATYIDGQVNVWIQKVYELRNIIAHRSKARDVQMFLIDKTGLHMPKLSDGNKDLLSYCHETYGHLKLFIFDIERNFLVPKASYFYDMK